MERSGVLEMFVLYVDDAVLNGTCDYYIKESNTLILLTCTTYLIYDARSMEERSKAPIEAIVNILENRAIEKCMIFARELCMLGDMDALQKLHNNLGNAKCKTEIKKLLKQQQGGEHVTIEI